MHLLTRLLTSCTLACCLLSSIVLASPRPERYGIALPYPKKAMVPTAPDSLLVGQPEQSQEFWLDIDAKGVIQHASSNAMVSQEWLRRLERWLVEIPFEPGRRHGKKTPMRIPAHLFLSTGDSSASFIVPIDHSRRVVDYNLFVAGLHANGVDLPAIDSFPWYHANVSRSDTAVALRFVLARVVLSGEGTPTSISLAKTNYPDFAGQLLTAINYGRFRAAKSSDTVPIDTVFLSITFFPTSQYPTRPWSSDWVDSLDLLDRQALRMLVDTAEDYLIPPLPKARTEGPFLVPWPRKMDQRGIVLRYRIDTLGIAKPILSSVCDSQLCQMAKALADQISYYPALDFNGRPRSYSGYVIAFPTDELNVRVKYSWLLPL